jgi:hypothetical protein
MVERIVSPLRQEIKEQAVSTRCRTIHCVATNDAHVLDHPFLLRSSFMRPEDIVNVDVINKGALVACLQFTVVLS